jgi:hypothetical protein
MHANEVGAPDVLNYNWDNDEGFWLPMRLPGTFPTIMDELPEGVFNLYYTATRFWRILHLRALCRARVVTHHQRRQMMHKKIQLSPNRKLKPN